MSKPEEDIAVAVAAPSDQVPGPKKNKNRKKKKKRSTNKQKTICFQFAETGKCRYGDKCIFVHQAREEENKPPPRDPMDDFFAQYPTFDYDRSRPLWNEFRRMRRMFSWNNYSDEGKQAMQDFRLAMVEQFNTIYGTDENELESWHRLCRVLNLTAPPTLRESQMCIRKTHVNLVDLVENARTGQPIKIFPNLEALQEYTRATGNIFPKEDAYAGGLLRMLLREIFHTYHGNKGYFGPRIRRGGVGNRSFAA